MRSKHDLIQFVSNTLSADDFQAVSITRKGRIGFLLDLKSSTVWQNGRNASYGEDRQKR